MYNSMKALPKIPYQILSYLALNDEVIWKLLAYNDYDALSKPNLTFSEKMNLVWRTGPQEKYGVFMTNLVEDAICESKCIMKFYSHYIHADSPMLSTTVYCFDFLFGGQMSLVEYEGIPVNRGDLFIHRILDTLNGVYVGGVGKFVFDEDQSRYDLAHTIIANSKTFVGKQIFMSVMIGDTGRDEGCVD